MLPSDVALLRSLVEWRRANGWTVKYRRDRRSRDYDHEQVGEVTVHRHEGIEPQGRYYELSVHYSVGDDGEYHLPLWPRTVGEAAEVLAAIRVLPVMLSPAFRAGRKSVYDRAGYRVTTPRGERPGSQLPIRSAVEAFRTLGFWRRNGWHDAYLEIRWDKEPSDWERIHDEVTVIPDAV